MKLPQLDFKQSSPGRHKTALWVTLLGLALSAAPAHAHIRAAHHHARKTAGNRLGDAIVAFARTHQGQVVGDGQCATLADTALRAIGARTADTYGDIAANPNYVWGRPVALADARPGDIVQFSNYNVSTEVTTTLQYADGRSVSSQSSNVVARPHHTAIVARNLGTTLAVLEQNGPPSGGPVVENTLEVAPRTYQTVTRNDDVPTQVTTQVQVQGEMHIYRPQPASQLVANAK